MYVNRILRILEISWRNLLGKCPLTHDGVFGLSDEHEVTNVPCGRNSIRCSLFPNI
jgi:hypothetical protein